MSDLIDGLHFGFDFLQWMVGLAFMAFWFRAVGRLVREGMRGLNPSLGRDPPSGTIAIRRMWCRHTHISRVRNAWGLNYTACTKCGSDVNAGKRKEFW
jgi:hypothetical protein